MLYCLGEEAEDILASTNVSDDQRKQYEAVLLKFDSFFRVRKNVIIERAKFNRRSQLPNEPAEQVIASLYNIAADCNFGDLKNELIRDRIVVGIRNQALSEQLQSDPELMLEEAKTLVRQREAIRDKQQFLKPSSGATRQSNPLRNTLVDDQIKETQVTRDLSRAHLQKGQRNVLVVAKVHTVVRSAQPKMLLVKNARKKVILVSCTEGD